MSTLYLTRRSTVVSREGHHILVKQYPIASSQSAYTVSIQESQIVQFLTGEFYPFLENFRKYYEGPERSIYTHFFMDENEY